MARPGPARGSCGTPVVAQAGGDDEAALSPAICAACRRLAQTLGTTAGSRRVAFSRVVSGAGETGEGRRVQLGRAWTYRISPLGAPQGAGRKGSLRWPPRGANGSRSRLRPRSLGRPRLAGLRALGGCEPARRVRQPELQPPPVAGPDRHRGRLGRTRCPMRMRQAAAPVRSDRHVAEGSRTMHGCPPLAGKECQRGVQPPDPSPGPHGVQRLLPADRDRPVASRPRLRDPARRRFSLERLDNRGRRRRPGVHEAQARRGESAGPLRQRSGAQDDRGRRRRDAPATNL